MNFQREVEALSNKISPLLAGRPAELVGAVLADLLATWLASHVLADPTSDTEGAINQVATNQMREQLIDLHLRAVRSLIPINERKYE